MLKRFIPVLSTAAIVLATATIARADTLSVIFVDKSTLSSEQQTAFQQIASQYPTSEGGRECRSKRGSHIWCNVNDANTIQQIQQALQKAGIASETDKIERLPSRDTYRQTSAESGKAGGSGQHRQCPKSR